MRKVFCFLTVLLLCMSMVLPVFATEDSFVPSITYKPSPELEVVYDEYGNEQIGIIVNGEGEVISYVGHGCLRITPIAHIWDEEITVPDVIEQLLLSVYNALNDGSMQIPYEKHDANLDPANMVIRDLFDVRWTCEEHPLMLTDGAVLKLTFDLGVVADAELFVQTFDEELNEWDPIVSVENNGDGTITCSFAHLCAVEVSMPLAPVAPSVVTTEAPAAPNVTLWIILLCVATAAVVGVVVFKRKKTAA